MLGASKIIAFVPTKNSRRSRAFYEGALGLRFVSDDAFALVLDANGIMVRITKVSEMTPAPFTVLGWEVPRIEDVVSRLVEKGVKLEKYGITGQDERGIWSAPSGARVAWFKDPDGNVLSLTQFR
jgi:catechol 2,3-dioxygenase-like lactoylglutathione lyase family enzyme